MDATLTADEVAAVLGVTRQAVYSKMVHGSLSPLPGISPYRYAAKAVHAYAATLRGGHYPTRHGQPTAYLVIPRLLREAGRPLHVQEIVVQLFSEGIGTRWKHPVMSCLVLLRQHPQVRRTTRGYYTLKEQS